MIVRLVETFRAKTGPAGFAYMIIKAARRRRRSPADGFELKELAWDLMNMGKDRQFPIHSLTDQS
jgi:hypothetical protein